MAPSRAQNQSFTSYIPLIQEFNGTEPVVVSDSDKQFRLSDVVGNMNFNYYAYNGSITTPECNCLISRRSSYSIKYFISGYETVTYIIPSDYRLKTKGQEIDEFRRIKDSNGNPIRANYRELQPLNGRPIYSGNTSLG